MCVKDYNMGKPNGEAKEDFIVSLTVIYEANPCESLKFDPNVFYYVYFQLRKGESLHIPTWCIHRDPQFFPNPNKFDPERFSKENRHLIHPIAYMPFGLGPRNCIGKKL